MDIVSISTFTNIKGDIHFHMILLNNITLITNRNIDTYSNMKFAKIHNSRNWWSRTLEYYRSISIPSKLFVKREFLAIASLNIGSNLFAFHDSTGIVMIKFLFSNCVQKVKHSMDVMYLYQITYLLICAKN